MSQTKSDHVSAHCDTFRNAPFFIHPFLAAHFSGTRVPIRDFSLAGENVQAYAKLF